MDNPTKTMPSPNISSVQKVALFSVFVAIGVVIQLLPRPPNAEFTSLLTFVVGAMFGSVAGVLCGGLIMFVNGFLSPWGVAGLMMPFQMTGMAIAGVVGSIYRRNLSNRRETWFFIEAGVLGALIALIYDVITNIGVAVSFVIVGTPPLLALFSAFAWGAPFSLIHVVSNTIVFGVVFLPLMNTLNNLLEGVGVWSKKEPLRS